MTKAKCLILYQFPLKLNISSSLSSSKFKIFFLWPKNTIYQYIANLFICKNKKDNTFFEIHFYSNLISTAAAEVMTNVEDTGQRDQNLKYFTKNMMKK